MTLLNSGERFRAVLALLYEEMFKIGKWGIHLFFFQKQTSSFTFCFQIKKLQEIMEMKGKVLYVCPYTFKKHFKEAAENLAWGEAYLYATEPK